VEASNLRADSAQEGGNLYRDRVLNADIWHDYRQDDNSHKLPEQEFSRVIRHTPLVCIDLVIRDSTHNVLVGLRRNEPAKGYYFVPGGRIRKNETLEAAFSRIVIAETGLDISFGEARLLGVFEHIYSTNRFGDAGYGTHCVALAYQIALTERPVIKLDDQHDSSKWLDEEELKAAADVHPYAKAYFGG
jgi:GDP-mannose mannosyl hydrolase